MHVIYTKSNQKDQALVDILLMIEAEQVIVTAVSSWKNCFYFQNLAKFIQFFQYFRVQSNTV